MVTAETAAVLPVLALLLAFCAWSLSALSNQLRCVDAAREAARAAARGEPPDQVHADAVQAAPAGAVVSVSTDAGEIRVVVSAQVGAGPGWIPRLTVIGTAVAAVEPAVAG